MKRFGKKALALLFSLILLVVSAAGCQSALPAATSAPNVSTAAPEKTAEPAATTPEPTAEPTADPNKTPWGLDKSETYSIKCLGVTDTGKASWKLYSETAVGKVILDKFNMDFEFVTYTETDVEKANLLLAAGDYYEIQGMQTAVVRQAYMDAGALISLDDYLGKMTNFANLFSVQMPYWRATAADGKLYYWQGNGCPYTLEDAIPCNGIMVRADALELYAQKHGWDNPPIYTTDFEEVIKLGIDAGLKDVNGKTAVGLTSCFGESWGLAGIAQSLHENCADYGASDSRTIVYNFKDGKWVSFIDTPVMKDQYRFYNALYNSGCLDEECFTDMGAQTVEKYKTASAIACWYITWDEATANGFIREAGHPEMQYVALPCVASVNSPKEGMKLICPRYPTNDFDNIGVTKNAKNPDRILELLDYLCSDEGAFLNYNGIQGVNWDYDTAGVRQYIDTDYIRRSKTDDPTYDLSYSNMTGIGGLFRWYGLSYGVKAKDGYAQNITQTEYNIKKWTDTKYLPNQLRAKYGWTTNKDWLMKNTEIKYAVIPYGIAFETGSDFDIINQKMLEVRLHNIYDVWTAKDFDTAYQKMLDEYYATDYQKVLDEYNRLSDEIVAKVTPK